MEKKEEYMRPKLDILSLDCKDIIQTSGCTTGDLCPGNYCQDDTCSLN